jgi:hypothetical protein
MCGARAGGGGAVAARPAGAYACRAAILFFWCVRALSGGGPSAPGRVDACGGGVRAHVGRRETKE